MNSIFEAIIEPPIRDLGDGFEVRRVLPSKERRTVGPFLFFDQMGRPCCVRDRDSPRQSGDGPVIRPGEVNRMTAGREIVHSERVGLA